MNTKCILFDADGVVINSEMFSVLYQKKFGVSNDEMLPFFKGAFQDCLIGKADLKEAVKPYLIDWEWSGTVDDFLKFWFKAEHSVDEKILNLIQNLQAKNIKCYLATNQEKYRIEYMKNEMGFNDIFDHIFYSAEIGFKKPEQKYYQYIYKWLNSEYSVNKDEILFIDDSQNNINEAKSFGLNAHLYSGCEDLIKLI